MSARVASVFSNRSFRLYYAGQIFSYVGDGLRIIAIPLLVFHLTGSALDVGVTYALELGPFALFGLVGGSLADRIDRRALMIATDAIRCAVLIAFAVGYATHALSLPMLYVGIVAISLAAAVFMGGQASAIPYLLGKDRATQAVAALLAAEQTTQTVVPPIGGAFFALVGPLPASRVPTLGPARPSGMPSPRDVIADIGTGFAFAWRDRTMRALSIVMALFNFFGLMTGAVFIPFLKRDFGASDTIVGIALGIGAIGAVGGSWLAGRVPSRWPLGRVLVIAYAADGLLFLPVMLARELRVAIVFLALTNACVLFEIAQIVGWRMRVTPEALVGRVFGAVRLIVLFGTVPGALLGGYLADRYGVRVPIVVSGIGYLAMTAIVACVPAIRNERR